MLLMALVDTDYCFISIDVGAYSAYNDCNTFKNSNLNIPGSRPLPNEDNDHLCHLLW